VAEELEKVLASSPETLSLLLGAETLTPKDAVAFALLRLAKNPTPDEEKRAEAVVAAYRKTIKELKDGTAELSDGQVNDRTD